jgi:copper chaperone CopZ
VATDSQNTIMTTTYQLSGLTCEACVYKVQYILGQVPEVEQAQVILSNQTAEIASQKPIPLSVLKEAFRPHAKYSIDTQKIIESTPSVTWISQYKPLLLIVGFISGVAFLTAFHGGVFAFEHFELKHFLHNFMTGFFLVFSFFKLLNLNEFANSFAMYDLFATRVPMYGRVYPFLELGLGVLCLIHFQPKAVYLADVILMGFGNLGVIQSVLDKRKIRCACLGSVFNLPMSSVTIIENTLMVIIGIVLLLMS